MSTGFLGGFGGGHTTLALPAAATLGSAALLYACCGASRPKDVPHDAKLPRLKLFVSAVGARLKVGFDTVIGLAALEVEKWCRNDGLVYSFTVPERLCNADGTLPLSVAMSLFDTVSSYAIVGEDHYHRPGVSITLNASFVARDSVVRAGQTIHVASKVSKVGGTMGFATCAIRDAATGATLITGEHIKYLPMGSAWNAMFGGLLYPLVRCVAANTKVRPPSQAVMAAQAAPLRDLVELQDVAPRDDGGHSAVFSTTKAHANPMGGVHGGCQAVLCERLAALAKPRGKVRGMTVTYVSGGRGTLSLTSTPTAHAVGISIQRGTGAGQVVSTAEVAYFDE